VGIGSKNNSEHIDVNSSVMSAADGRTTPKKINAPCQNRLGGCFDSRGGSAADPCAQSRVARPRCHNGEFEACEFFVHSRRRSSATSSGSLQMLMRAFELPQGIASIHPVPPSSIPS